MSGIAIAAFTIPGSVAPLASWVSEASVRMCAISTSSATINAGTRIPFPASRGIRQRYGPTRSTFMDPEYRSSCRGRLHDGRAAAVEPGQTGHGDGHADDARELRDAEGAEPEAVQPDRFDREAPDRVEADVAEEQRPRTVPETRAEHQHEEQEHEQVPQRLVEERRMEEVGLREARRPVRRRDVELPRQGGRPAERLFVEEVPPAADGLSDGDAGRRRVETAQDRQAPPMGEPEPHDGPGDEPAVDGEAALPDRDDLRRVLAVVIPVEDHLVDPGPHQPGENRPLRDADEVLGRQSFAPCLSVPQPEADDDGGGHQDAVPADDEGTELKGDRAG